MTLAEIKNAVKNATVAIDAGEHPVEE